MGLMRMFMFMDCTVCVGVVVGMRVTMTRFVLVIVRMRPVVVAGFVLPMFLQLCDHIDFGSSESAASDFAHLKASADVECRGSLFKHGKGHARIDERAEQHVAADAGKAIQIANSHWENCKRRDQRAPAVVGALLTTCRAASALRRAAQRSTTRNGIRCSRA